MVNSKTRWDKRFESLETGDCRYCFNLKDSPPDPPDMSVYADASKENAELAAAIALEQMDWAKQQWGDQKQLLQDVLDVQLPILRSQFEAGEADRARYEEIFQPVEDSLVAEFQSYASPERMELEAGQAAADVTRAFEAQRENAQRQLEQYGIDPSQTRQLALDSNLRAQEAAAQAAAQNQARRNVENLGRSLRAEAINIGKGYPSNVAGAYGQALQAGNSAMGNMNQTVGAGVNAMSAPNAYLNTSMAGYGQAGSLMNQGYQNQLAQYQQGNSGLGALGSLAGTIGGAYLGNPSLFTAEGGAIEGPGGPKDDAIPARLSDGEYVIPAEVVQRKGTEFFDKLVAKTKGDLGMPEEPPPQQVAPGYAMGGEVERYNQSPVYGQDNITTSGQVTDRNLAPGQFYDVQGRLGLSGLEGLHAPPSRYQFGQQGDQYGVYVTNPVMQPGQGPFIENPQGNPNQPGYTGGYYEYGDPTFVPTPFDFSGQQGLPDEMSLQDRLQMRDQVRQWMADNPEVAKAMQDNIYYSNLARQYGMENKLDTWGQAPVNPNVGDYANVPMLNSSQMDRVNALRDRVQGGDIRQRIDALKAKYAGGGGGGGIPERTG